MLSAVAKRRLAKLADFLETIPQSQFDLSDWFVINGENFKIVPVGEVTLKQAKEFNCTTVGCAVGWACQIPSFKRAGLKLEIADKFSNDEDFTNAAIVYKGYEDFDAVEEFFEIDNWQARFLFHIKNYKMPEKQITPRTVAKRIRLFIEYEGYVELTELKEKKKKVGGR